jgi:isopentenyl-diphosphate delta-isomerase
MNKYQYSHVDPISEEHVVLVDTNNNVLGIAPKATVHTMETPLHRAFSCFLFNEQGELLLQQRSHKKKTWPLVWSNTCCGHPALYESNEDAVVRRLSFELGITGVVPVLMLPDFQYRAERFGVVEHEICPVFVGQYTGTPQFNPDEVEFVRWIDWHAFQQEIKDEPGKYSEWCEWEVELLAALPDFQSWYEGLSN